MSFVTLMATAVLSVAVYQLRRDLAETRGEVSALRIASSEERAVFDQADRDDDSSLARSAPAPAPRLAPAALVPSAGSAQAGVPSSLASAEIKAEVQKILTEEITDAHRRREGMREQRELQMRERMATELGLSQAEKERFLTVFTSMQAERQLLRDQERSGVKTTLDVRAQMDALLQKSDQSVREILGDERMQKYLDLRPAERGFGGGMASPPPPPGP